MVKRKRFGARVSIFPIPYEMGSDSELQIEVPSHIIELMIIKEV